MSSLVYLSNDNGLHEYGLECLSTDKYTVDNFIYNQVVELCKKFDCKYFIQGRHLVDHGISWAFVEFFGESSQDKIIEIIKEFNNLYGTAYYKNEIMITEPTIELLKSLKLF
jgi:hypothetical protein